VRNVGHDLAIIVDALGRVPVFSLRSVDAAWAPTRCDCDRDLRATSCETDLRVGSLSAKRVLMRTRDDFRLP
jgi:hypothetical protein